MDTRNVVGIRWDWSRNGLTLTQVKTSPRGTRYFGAQTTLKRDWPDKKTQRAAIQAALEKLGEVQPAVL